MAMRLMFWFNGWCDLEFVDAVHNVTGHTKVDGVIVAISV